MNAFILIYGSQGAAKEHIQGIPTSPEKKGTPLTMPCQCLPCISQIPCLSGVGPIPIPASDPVSIAAPSAEPPRPGHRGSALERHGAKPGMNPSDMYKGKS